MLDALTSGRADAAFLWLPIGDDPRFSIHPLLPEDRWVALPPGHPLESRRSLHIADLADVPVVGPRDGMPPAVVDFWFIDPRPDGTRPLFGPQARTPEECLHLVAAGQAGSDIDRRSGQGHPGEPGRCTHAVVDHRLYRPGVG